VRGKEGVGGPEIKERGGGGDRRGRTRGGRASRGKSRGEGVGHVKKLFSNSNLSPRQ